jgi:hypothetical protein
MICCTPRAEVLRVAAIKKAGGQRWNNNPFIHQLITTTEQVSRSYSFYTRAGCKRPASHSKPTL